MVVTTIIRGHAVTYDTLHIDTRIPVELAILSETIALKAHVTGRPVSVRQLAPHGGIHPRFHVYRID